ncbi:MAG: chemotaxis protein CheR [Lentisphaerae bacterium]|nr:chemotaxis protein CheR [Lentisphaerota bacterium]
MASQHVERSLGLHFPEPRYAELERALVCATNELDLSGPEALVGRLGADRLSQREIEVLAGQLTIGETHFFRDRPVFDTLENEFLPPLIASRRQSQPYLRIWSAACCTGEEAYSLAILLHRLIPDWHDWNITILATDINPVFLDRAASGRYRPWSFRSTPDWLQAEYFRPGPDDTVDLLPEIRRMVTFSYLNLVDATYPSPATNTNAMDLIMCRNVLMYFAPDRARVVVRKLVNSLVEGGCLLLSACEASTGLFEGLPVERTPAGFAYCRATPTPPALASPRLRESRARSRPPRADQEGALSRTQIVFKALLAKEASHPAIQDEQVDGEAGAAYERASCLYSEGHYPDAIRELQAVDDRDELSLAALVLAARACANAGELEQALSWCVEAIMRDRADPAPHLLQASVLQELGRDAEAVSALRRCLYLDANRVLAHFNLGNLALRKSDRKTAAKHFRHARDVLASCPTDSVIPDSGGLTAGRLDQLIVSLLKGLERDAA